MVSVDLFKFAANKRPPYFDPEVDVEVFDENDGEWQPIFRNERSIRSLIADLNGGSIGHNHIRFKNETIQQYLTYIKEGDISQTLHHETALSRQQLVNLADEGYKKPEDFLGPKDPIDIARETSVDRDIITRIAANYLGGFSSGNSFGNVGPLAGLEPANSFKGWDLVQDTPNQIRWVSAGRFNLTISPTPDGDTKVIVNTPKAKQNSWYRKGYQIQLEDIESLNPEEALNYAHNWLSNNQFEFQDDLADLPLIGPSTKDYLYLEYGIAKNEDLVEFAEEQPREFDEVFGDKGTELKEALEKD